MTNDQMTALQFTIITVLLEHHKPLLAPVLQHLTHGVVVHVGTLQRIADVCSEGCQSAVGQVVRDVPMSFPV